MVNWKVTASVAAGTFPRDFHNMADHVALCSHFVGLRADVAHLCQVCRLKNFGMKGEKERGSGRDKKVLRPALGTVENPQPQNLKDWANITPGKAGGQKRSGSTLTQSRSQYGFRTLNAQGSAQSTSMRLCCIGWKGC